MDLKIQVGLVKKLLKKCPNEAIEEAIEHESDNRIHTFDVASFNEKELDFLLTIAREASPEVQGVKGLVRKISTFKNIQKDPGGAKVQRVESLEEALRLYLKDVTNHWLFVDKDDTILPYYITKIEYSEYDARSKSPAHTDIDLHAVNRGSKVSHSVSWEASDLSGSGKTVAELLTDARLYKPTPELIAAYEKTMARYKDIQPKVGEQFTAEGEAEVLTGRWGSHSSSMVRDGVPDKLVMDDESKETRWRKDWNGNTEEEEVGSFGEDEGLTDNCYWVNEEEASSVALPVHPYVRMFNLDLHECVILNTDQLTEYKWNPKLGEKLILPAEHKEVVTILMDTASEEIDDIIKGKSGGTIVICTGEPGTGKTLTAEVTSEVITRPLYKVHCSQLGTDETKVEYELSRVLARATRWKALLLIDEADVYIRARGEDIQQNAIVGVFLRILEYYRGVLFMTSNRGTVIDDAIMSRATVHLKYEHPTTADLKKIWLVLSEQFKIKMPETFIDSLVKTFPDISGRDVKALLKLAIRYSRKKGNKITLDLFKMLAAHKDIKVSGV